MERESEKEGIYDDSTEMQGRDPISSWRVEVDMRPNTLNAETELQGKK